MTVAALIALFVAATTGATVRAAGDGPGITLGAVSGTTVPVEATGGAPEPYKGFGLHVHATASAGVSGLRVTATSEGTTLPSTDGKPFCISKTSDGLPDDLLYGCTVVGSASTSEAGLLATFVIDAKGDGCVAVALATDPGSASLGSFTIGAADSLAQTNEVDTAPRDVLIGSGTTSDCAGGPMPAPTSGDTAVPGASAVAGASSAPGAGGATQTESTAGPAVAGASPGSGTVAPGTISPAASAASPQTALAAGAGASRDRTPATGAGEAREQSSSRATLSASGSATWWWWVLAAAGGIGVASGVAFIARRRMAHR